MITPSFQIKKQKETKDFGHFIIEALEPGYGHTLGNTLRRVLLTSLPGAAVTQVKIAGVRHKFSTLAGLKEDIIDLILNIKQIRVMYEGKKAVKLTLEKSGSAEVKAGDIKTPAGVEIVNPDLVLANLADKKSHLKVELQVETGVGYLPAEERETDRIGVILVDAAFSPVKRVNYWVEATRVGRQTNLDRLVLEITTDSTIKPSQALKKAAQNLVAYFNQIIEPRKAAVKIEKPEAITNEAMKLTVEELDLPTRIVNALRKGGYDTASGLSAAWSTDLARVKNLGEKSVEIIKAALAKKGLSLRGGSE